MLLMAFNSCLRFFLLAISAAVLASGKEHPDFPQWDPIPWVVPSDDVITLQCSHPEYYPFNDKNKMHNVQWILPRPTSYRHLKAGQSNEGWTVSNETYELIITKSSMNVPESVNGQYVCAALATVNTDGTGDIYSWYYLRWGVGLYSHVPAMKSGSIAHKYYWCFTYAWVTLLVTVVIMVLFAATVHFRYKGGPELSQEDEDDSDIVSVTVSMAKKQLSGDFKRDDDDRSVL